MSHLTRGQQAVRQHVLRFVEEYRPSAFSKEEFAPKDEELTSLLLRLAEALEGDSVVTSDAVTGSDVRPAPQERRPMSRPIPPLDAKPVPLGTAVWHNLLERLHLRPPPAPKNELDTLARRPWDWTDHKVIGPQQLVTLPPSGVFCYDRAPDPTRTTVRPRDPAAIYAAYFGGEKWRSTMRALLEVGLHDPLPPKVPNLRVHLPTGSIANGNDGTHRLLAAYLWGSLVVQITERGELYSSPREET